MEYFRLMLPPWDAKGHCNEWEKMAVRQLRAPNKDALPCTHTRHTFVLLVRAFA